jgi:hypothetical protein
MGSEAVRIGAYLATAGICVWAWRRELPYKTLDRAAIWPLLWLLTAVLLVSFGLARAIGAPELITEFGRAEAREAGAYDSRRGFQAAAVVGIAAAWMLAVFVAVWRIPERRRRYLPTLIIVMAIVAFAAIRVISLHHLDQVLYNRPLFGVRGVIFVELGLLTLLAASAAIRSRISAHLRHRCEPTRVTHVRANPRIRRRRERQVPRH